ncbi:ribonuclease H-like domain-containing protein [Tanacetum coccineum]
MAEEQELTEEQKAKLEANAELKESVLGKDLTIEDYAKRMIELELYVKLSKESRDMEVLTQLKKLNFGEVKAEFKKLVKQLDTYVPMNFEATKASLKRFCEELQTKTAKNLKFDDEGSQPTEEKIEEDKDDKPTNKTGKRRKQIARKGLHTDLDKDDSEDSDEASEKDDSTSGTKIPINPVPVAIKSPSIANYKIIKQGRKGVYQIVRENGTDMVYISFGAMLTDISRDDLTELYRIVMRKHGMNEPEDEFEKVLWEYLKNMFEEPLSTDSIWSLPGQQRLICWRYYDACRVHCLNLESVDIYMLIERKYPLSAEVCKAMLDKKLQGGKPDEDCYKLLKMMEKQAGIRKHKDWLVQEQTALGKDFSNPLMADNLPKIVWLSTHHICRPWTCTFLVAKGLATPELMANCGCSRHMTGNKAYLVEYQDYNGSPDAFRGSKGQITGKGKIITGKLDFEDVYFVKELKQFNLFSVSQMCDKKNKVLFTDSKCLVLSPDFKLPDENQVLLIVPRQNNMYSFNLENIVPIRGLACLIAKATVDESNKWHRRFSWVFFLRTKDGTSGILKNFIRQVENQLNQKVKTIRCDNGTEFKNRDIIEFCGSKGIKKEYSPKEANHSAGTQDNIDAGNSKMEVKPAQEYFVLPLWSSYTSTIKSSEAKNGDENPKEDTNPKTNDEPKDQEDQAFLEELERLKRQEKEAKYVAKAFRKEFAQCTEDLLLHAGAARATNDSQIPALEDIYDNPSDGIFTNASYDIEGAVADFTNLETTVNVSPIPTSRIHSIHPTTQILGDPTSAVQIRSKIEPQKISQALEDESWVVAIQEELLQFKIQKVWILVDLPFGKKAIRIK